MCMHIYIYIYVNNDATTTTTTTNNNNTNNIVNNNSTYTDTDITEGVEIVCSGVVKKVLSARGFRTSFLQR